MTAIPASRAALAQPGILAPTPAAGIALAFDVEPGADPRPSLDALRHEPADGAVVVGVGEPLVRVLRARVAGLRGFPALSGVGVTFPSTQGALWVYVRSDQRDEALDRAISIRRKLGHTWRLVEEVDAFRYRGGRDLTGFEDGTENPKGEAAVDAALIGGEDRRLAGGSFVAVQRFVHDLERFRALAPAARDAIIGRSLETNEEMPDAAASAHVKRSAQESFDPPAFMLRRSMPWGGVGEQGLYFVAFVEALDRFERMLRRMAGLDDGVADALLSISRALSGGYYFCPPMGPEGELNLGALLR